MLGLLLILISKSLGGGSLTLLFVGAIFLVGILTCVITATQVASVAMRFFFPRRRRRLLL
jgi:hypothetical protein